MIETAMSFIKKPAFWVLNQTWGRVVPRICRSVDIQELRNERRCQMPDQCQIFDEHNTLQSSPPCIAPSMRGMTYHDPILVAAETSITVGWTISVSGFDAHPITGVSDLHPGDVERKVIRKLPPQQPVKTGVLR